MEKSENISINHLSETDAKWFAVYTRYKREKLVLKLLTDKEIEVYLPIQHFTRRYSKKVKQVQLPLISCYIFVKILKQEYLEVLKTEHVVKFVRFSQNLISIPEEEMDIMRRVIGEKTELEVEEGIFNKGDKVEVIGGGLTGLRGKLIDKTNRQVIIEMETLGYSLKVNIEPQYLRRIK